MKAGRVIFGVTFSIFMRSVQAMKLYSVAALLAAATVVPEVCADKPRKAKDVGLGEDEDLCIFKNFDDSWCFTAEKPILKVGWEI